MRKVLGELDGLLRGKKSEPEVLTAGTDHLAVRRHIGYVVVLGALYGVAMGLYAAMTSEPGSAVQLAASAVKVPLLFLLSLVVTLPSFLVFSALLDVALSPREAVRVIVAAILVNVTVLASFAPITAFFTVCTESYPFMKLLSVFFFLVAGVIGMGFLRKLVGNLEKIRTPAPEPEPDPKPDPEPDPPPSPLPAAPDEAPPAPIPPADPPVLLRATPDERLTSRRLLRAWVVLYVIVACQMAWVLRPLVGDPKAEFAWFRFDERGGSFLLDLGKTLRELFGG